MKRRPPRWRGRGVTLRYVRLPLTDGGAPRAAAVDALIAAMADAGPTAPVVITCQMGGGEDDDGHGGGVPGAARAARWRVAAVAAAPVWPGHAAPAPAPAAPPARLLRHQLCSCSAWPGPAPSRGVVERPGLPPRRRRVGRTLPPRLGDRGGAAPAGPGVPHPG